MAQISVIVPVYQVEQYLHRCIDSVLRQSFRDFELILVDDGSPDRCGEICDQYAAKDSRIHVIHQKNGGLSAARNAGIDWVEVHSDSQWLAFIDSDDWVHRDYLQVLLNAAQDNNAPIAICDMIRTSDYREDEDLQNIQILSMDPERAYVERYGMCMAAWRKLYKRELFVSLRFPVGKLHEDCYITHIPLFAAEKVAVCDVGLYYYYYNPQSITRKKWTPKRLEELDSHEVRLAWLREHGYTEAAAMELEVYTVTVYAHIEVLMAQTGEEALAHRKALRKKLRELLNQCRRHGRLTFEMEHLWIYTMAYAGEGAWRLLRRIRSLRNRIR